MIDTQKVTAHLPKDLVARAKAASGKNLTETLKHGLELVAREQAYDKILRMGGKFKIDMTMIKSLRDDD